MERHQAARAALLPLCLLLLYLLNGCAAIPYDYPHPVSSALYRPEGTSLGKEIQAQAINHPGASGFYLLPTGIDAFTARALMIDQAACLLVKGISRARTYRVTLLGGDDLVWITADNEPEVRYYREPLSRFLPRLSLRGLAWLTPELML